MINDKRLDALIDKLVAAGLLVILDELPDDQTCSEPPAPDLSCREIKNSANISSSL